MGFELTFWKLKMVTYTQVRCTDLGGYVWVICVYMYGQYYVSHFDPHIWNNLPQDSIILSSFKSKLKTHFSEYFS